MHTIIKLDLAGGEHFFHFNNYALIELTKYTQKQDDIQEATMSLNTIIEQNFLLGITVIVYCGLVGYKYSKFEIKHGYTIDWVSEQVANVNLNEWAPIWEAYKDATGMSEFLKEQAVKAEAKQTQETPKKKHHSKQSLNLPSAK